jgi:hypothetical protein
MYSIERNEAQITVRFGGPNGKAVFMAAPDSLIVYKTIQPGIAEPTVAKVKDLNDEMLLRALVNSIEVKDFVNATAK